jgi:hypothetical protein
MDIVSKLTSYARAVPAGLKAAGQELTKTAGARTGADTAVPARALPTPRKKAARRSTRGKAVPAKTTGAKGTPSTAKRSAAKPQRRKARR